MAASFPGSVKSFTPVVNGATIQIADVNDGYDEIEAVEGAVIGRSRGGPLDKYMTADPGFSSAFGSGAARITYDAINDRLTVAPQSGDPLSGIYATLPTALKFTPSPSAIVKLHVEFVLEEFDPVNSAGKIYAGFLNHANPLTAALGVRMYRHDGGGAPLESGPIVCGSTGVDGNPLSAPTEDVRYSIEMSWQDGRILNLSGAMYNAATGAEVTAPTPYVPDPSAISAELPDFGVWFDDSTGDNIVLHIYDLWAEVIRL